MKIERSDVVDLFVALGIYTAPEWKNERFERELGYPKRMALYAEGLDPLPPMYLKVTAAYARKEVIVVVPDGVARPKPKKVKPPRSATTRPPEGNGSVGYAAQLADYKVRPRRKSRGANTLVSVIVEELIRSGRAQNPVTKPQIMETLRFKFPDRPERGMKITLDNLLGTKLRVYYQIPVKSCQTGFAHKGYWVDEAELPKA